MLCHGYSRLYSLIIDAYFSRNIPVIVTGRRVSVLYTVSDPAGPQKDHKSLCVLSFSADRLRFKKACCVLVSLQSGARHWTLWGALQPYWHRDRWVEERFRVEETEKHERFVEDQGMLWQSSFPTGVWGLAFSFHCEKTVGNESRGQAAQGRDSKNQLYSAPLADYWLYICACTYKQYFSFCTNNHRTAAVFFLLWRFDCSPGKAGARTHSNGLL